MKPASRIKSTIELLGNLKASPVPMDKTIADYMRNRRYIGSKDRANIAQRLYDIMRAYARISWWLEKTGTDDNPRTRVLFWLMLKELKNGSFSIEQLFDGTKYGPEVLSKDELKLCTYLSDKNLDDEDMPLGILCECPEEYEEPLLEIFGDSFSEEMKAMLNNAPLDLRVYLSKQGREEVKAALQKDRVITEVTPYSEAGLRSQDKVFISKTKAFVKGWIDIQDEGSQLIAALCEAKPSMQVLDYCAGGGGKTLCLADAMGGKGRIVAMDIDERRLNKAKPRFKRAGVSDMIEVRALSEDRSKKWLKRQKGTFDIVLVDAPCSGSGTWRRNPDTRWRQFGPSLEELKNTQSEILYGVCKAVKSSGKLVYATCSLLPEENEKQIEKFLSDHEDFSLCELETSFANGPYMRLSPYKHNTDGFFAAVLQRNA